MYSLRLRTQAAIQKNDASRVVTADALRSPPLSLAVAAVTWGTRNLHSAANIARGTAEMVMAAMQDDILTRVDELEADHESLDKSAIIDICGEIRTACGQVAVLLGAQTSDIDDVEKTAASQSFATHLYAASAAAKNNHGELTHAVTCLGSSTTTTASLSEVQSHPDVLRAQAAGASDTCILDDDIAYKVFLPRAGQSKTKTTSYRDTKATKDTKCFNCEKYGHWAADCWSGKPAGPARNRGNGAGNKRQRSASPDRRRNDRNDRNRDDNRGRDSSKDRGSGSGKKQRRT